MSNWLFSEDKCSQGVCEREESAFRRRIDFKWALTYYIEVIALLFASSSTIVKRKREAFLSSSSCDTSQPLTVVVAVCASFCISLSLSLAFSFSLNMCGCECLCVYWWCNFFARRNHQHHNPLMLHTWRKEGIFTWIFFLWRRRTNCSSTKNSTKETGKSRERERERGREEERENCLPSTRHIKTRMSASFSCYQLRLWELLVWEEKGFSLGSSLDFHRTLCAQRHFRRVCVLCRCRCICISV